MPDLQLKELGVEFQVNGVHPVQAVGTIRGRAFTFHAKHSNWTFEVANDLGELPSDVGGNRVFVIESRHNNASFMAENEAAKIISECCKLFLAVTIDKLKVLGS